MRRRILRNEAVLLMSTAMAKDSRNADFGFFYETVNYIHRFFLK